MAIEGLNVLMYTMKLVLSAGAWYMLRDGNAGVGVSVVHIFP